MKTLALLLALSALTSARYVVKRSNAYGDEAVTPAPAAPVAPADAGAAPVAPETPATPAEEAPKTADQPAPCGETKTQASGYRAKRSNSYGDEAVTPAAPAAPADAGTAPAPTAPETPATPAEEAPKPADQPAPCGEAKTEASGYRAKRSNSYGDEAVTPAPTAPADAGAAPAAPASPEAPATPAEEAPKTADQPAPCGETKTQASGYRAKRSNSYGDEAVTPAAPAAPAVPAEGGAAPATPSAPATPAEEAPKPADQPAPCGEAKTEASGYRI